MGRQRYSSIFKSGAVFLLLVCAFELYTRLDAMIKPLKMFFNMWIGEGISLQSGIKYVDFSIIQMPLFLFSSVVFSFLLLLLKPSIKKSFAYISVSLGLIYFANLLKADLFPELWMFIKLAPLVCIIVGSLLFIIADYKTRQDIRKTRSKELLVSQIKSGREQEKTQNKAYDPFRLNK